MASSNHAVAQSLRQPGTAMSMAAEAAGEQAVATERMAERTAAEGADIEVPAVERDAPIFVAGHRGMVGSALLRRLQQGGYSHILTRSRAELDLLDQRAVFDFFAREQPAYVFMAAARVGGIHANNVYRAQFLYENLAIQSHVIQGAHAAGVARMLFLGSSCIYPRDCPQPIREEYLLSGPLEQTNEPYAIAKIAGIKLAENYNRQYGRHYISAMPTNLYGPNDNYDLDNSHVLPALIRKAHVARQRGERHFVVWGSGAPKREFLHVDDLADACVFLMESRYDGPWLNIGSGEDLTIRELAALVQQAVGFDGELVFDSSKPDGTPRKLLDVSRLAAAGWRARIQLRQGILDTYREALAHGLLS